MSTSPEMLAAVYRGPDDLRVERVPVPSPGAGEMLVRVDACGVCGTDVKKIQKGLLPGPRVFGHEIAGTVARAGSGVTRFREGDRVALHHHIPCGDCFYCRLGVYAQCAGYKRNGTSAGFEAAGGGFAEFVLASDWIVEGGAIPIPDGVRAEEAAFIEPLNTCLKAVARAGVERGQTVLVVGQGPIGILLMQVARRKGARVLVSDTIPDRLALARELGADACLDASGDVLSEVRASTEGRGVDRALVAALGQAPLDQAIGAARPGGRVLIFAATSPGERADVDFGALCAAEKEIVTSYSASVEVQELAARLIFDREIRVGELISHRFSLTEAPQAVATASRPGPDVMKVMLEPGG
jgi:L-iditol 2-dehydrogenase